MRNVKCECLKCVGLVKEWHASIENVTWRDLNCFLAIFPTTYSIRCVEQSFRNFNSMRISNRFQLDGSSNNSGILERPFFDCRKALTRNTNPLRLSTQNFCVDEGKISSDSRTSSHTTKGWRWRGCEFLLDQCWRARGGKWWQNLYPSENVPNGATSSILIRSKRGSKLIYVMAFEAPPRNIGFLGAPQDGIGPEAWGITLEQLATVDWPLNHYSNYSYFHFEFAEGYNTNIESKYIKIPRSISGSKR